jgi:hypothetical protein
MALSTRHAVINLRAVREAIAASRNDPRPSVTAHTLFAELDALIDDVAAERGEKHPQKSPRP